MPGINFSQLREQITMEEVLDRLRFKAATRAGDQCPMAPVPSTARHHRKVTRFPSTCEPVDITVTNATVKEINRNSGLPSRK